MAASGGSTNAVLHLIAIGDEMGIPLSIDEFDVIARRTPIVATWFPAGKFIASTCSSRWRSHWSPAS